MDTLQIILSVILAIPLWRLYHKVFIVFYRDVFWGVLGEIGAAWLTAYILVGVAFMALGGILSVVGKILVVLLKVGLVLAAIGGVLWVVAKVTKNS